MEPCQYYDGLNPRKLAHEDSWFIVPMEAAWYCKTLSKKYIRYSHLKEKSNESLNDKTKGARPDFGGNYDKIIKRCEREKLLRIVKVSKKHTRIYPNIALIEKEVKRKQIENLSYYGNKRIAVLEKKDTLNRVRELSDTYTASERINVTVIRANPKEV
jgi:hypothetical protein